MPGTGSAPRLWGRDGELRVLHRALERAERGAPAAVVVEGEPGIGKSALLARLLDEAARRDVEVTHARAHELERARPFALWTAALHTTPTATDAARARIAALLAPPQAPEPVTVTSDPGLRFQVVDAIVDLVEDLAHERPVVVAFDDLQWADPSSLLTLTSLVRRLRHTPVLVVLCTRPRSADGDLDRALAAVEDAGAETVRLGPLGGADVAGLVADVLHAEPGPELLDRVTGAGGNPLYVTELLAAMGRDGGAAGDAARPPSLALTIVRHLGSLSEPALEALRPASVLGSAFTVSELATVTGRPVGALAPALSEAIAAGVLGEDGDRLRFRHDLIRDAVYDDLPRSVRQAWHQEAGRRLAEAGAPSVTVAEHVLRGPVIDDAALRRVRQGARDVAAGSPAVAAALLDRAVQALGPSDPRRLELAAERAGDLLWAGRSREAEVLSRQLLAGGLDAAAEQALRIGLGRALLVEGRVAEGVEEFRRAEDTLPTAAAGVDVRAWLGMARATAGDLDGAVTTARTVLASSAAADDHFAAAMALGALAVSAEARGDLHEALETIDRAVARTAADPGAARRYPAQVTRAHILTELDRFAEARTALAGQIGEGGPAPDRGDGHPRWHSARIILGHGQFVTGDWDDAVASLETGLELVEETGQTSSAVFGRAILAIIALHRGHRAEARHAADRAVAQVASGGSSFRSERAAWAHARVLEEAGEQQQAFAVLTESWDRCARHGTRVELPLLGPDLVRLARAAGDRGRAGEVADALDALAATHAVPSFAAAALRCRGLHDTDPEPLLAAVTAYSDSGRPLALALTAEEAASVLLDHGSSDATGATARALLERAVAGFESLHAAHDVARVDARLRALGVHRGRRGPRTRPRTGWAALTPTEERVVGLVAEGLSNPQIGDRLYLSRRTVQTHLSHVFAKLDLTSRAQLAAAAARRASADAGA